MKTHKNADVFSKFSERTNERGFGRAVLSKSKKKLATLYGGARDALSKRGSSRDEKDKCPWYNELDKILGHVQPFVPWTVSSRVV